MQFDEVPSTTIDVIETGERVIKMDYKYKMKKNDDVRSSKRLPTLSCLNKSINEYKKEWYEKKSGSDTQTYFDKRSGKELEFNTSNYVQAIINRHVSN